MKPPTPLPPTDWRPLRDAHAAAVEPLCGDREQRRSRQQTHPIDDFLFDYYAVRPAFLRRWSPGPGVVLADAKPWQIGWNQQFIVTPDGLTLPPFPAARRDFLVWLTDYLTAVAARPPLFGCFGLHEWAMVYRTEIVRHPTTPLRLPPAEIDAVVESSDLRCTHFDAFRFFTPAAAPRNRIPLSRTTTHEHDQPGCVHVTMDLFKYALKLSPWCPSALLLETLLLARRARQIDMRASPYDLTAFGLPPIPIETKPGRDEYAAAQAELQQQSEPLRAHLLSLLATLST